MANGSLIKADHAMPRRPVPYREARGMIQDGDLLLWLPSTLSGNAITTVTHSLYSHAAMAAWWRDHLMVLESVQWRGGDTARLSDQVARWPGLCDVYRVPGEYRWCAVDAAIERIHVPYGWLSLAHILARKYLGLCRHSEYIVPPTTPLVCSAFVCDSYRRAGLDLVPGKPAWAAEPGDIAKAGKYLLTIGGAA